MSKQKDGLNAPCGADLAGWSERERADYYQAHKSHDCLWDHTVEPIPVRIGRRLGVMLSLRLRPEDMENLRGRVPKGQTVSGFLRWLIHKPDPIPMPDDLALRPGVGQCQHFQIGNVIGASCGVCGPLPLTRPVMTNG